MFGNIRVASSLRILERPGEHDSFYLVKWAAEALEAFAGHESSAPIEKAKARLTPMDRVDGVFPELFPRG